MARKLLVSIVAIGVAGAGAVIFQDEIQTALFDTDKFTACFKNEVIANYQSEQALRGSAFGMISVEAMLGPSWELLGYKIAESVKRNGFNSVKEEAQSQVLANTNASLTAYQETGQIPEKDIGAKMYDARVECLERQQLW